jgi:uncharacterized protein (TIGR02466 family)
MVEVYNVFPTLIMVFDLSQHPANQRLKDLIEKTPTGTHALVGKGTSTYKESTSNSFLKNPTISDFTISIQQCINQFTAQAGLQPCSIKNSWFNKMGKGGQTIIHRHEFRTISGAYYPIWDNDCCNLRFRSPIAQCKMSEMSDSQQTIYNSNEQEVQGGVGKLILFPSHLEHYTPKNNSDERWVVSFNASH